MNIFLNTLKPWIDVNHRVYWDRTIDLNKWKAGMARGSPSYLPAAIMYMHITDFIHYYGKDAFMYDWPRIRNTLGPGDKNICGRLDANWSIFVSNSYNLQPIADFYEISEDQRMILILVAQHPGITIIRLSQKIGIPKNYTKREVNKLLKENKLSMRQDNEEIKLFPAYERSVNHDPDFIQEL
jgi:hypothetical protein